MDWMSSKALPCTRDKEVNIAICCNSLQFQINITKDSVKLIPISKT